MTGAALEAFFSRDMDEILSDPGLDEARASLLEELESGAIRSAEGGISLYAHCIVKYRDAKTDAATALEGALR